MMKPIGFSRGQHTTYRQEQWILHLAVIKGKGKGSVHLWPLRGNVCEEISTSQLPIVQVE